MKKEMFMELGGNNMGLYVDIEKKFSGFNLNVKFHTRDNIIGLLGASGSGKSMTLRCIAGLETPHKGKIMLDEKVLYDGEKKINVKSGRRRSGFLFQNYALFPNMTVSQNIGFGLSRMSADEKMKIINEKINMMDFQGLENRFPSQLSGGQQQRVAIARAMAIDPEILLLDEPFSALDSHLRNKMEEKLKEVLSSYKGTTVFVSHNRDEIYRICKNIVIMDNGAVEVFGDRNYIFENPGTAAAARLTGCKNISRIKILDENTLEALDWGCTLKVNKKIKKSQCYVGIRAHYISLGESEQKDNIVKCTVNHINESPFTVEVCLDSVEEGAYGKTESLRWEITKEMWHNIENLEQPWDICIGKEQLFLMRSN